VAEQRAQREVEREVGPDCVLIVRQCTSAHFRLHRLLRLGIVDSPTSDGA